MMSKKTNISIRKLSASMFFAPGLIGLAGEANAMMLDLTPDFNILGLGVSAGAVVTFPGPKTKDSFDIGGYGGVAAPGFPWSKIFQNTINPNYPNVPGGLNLGKLTIDVGYEWGGRSALSGVGQSISAGAGLWGGTLNLAQPQASLPISGFQANIGPQLRATGELSITGTYTIGNFLQDVIFPAVDAVKSLLSPSVPNQQIQGGVSNGSSSAASGGFLLYPNKANTNMTQSVYAK
jgi:hypothetical protein